MLLKQRWPPNTDYILMSTHFFLLFFEELIRQRSLQRKNKLCSYQLLYLNRNGPLFSLPPEPRRKNAAKEASTIRISLCVCLCVCVSMLVEIYGASRTRGGKRSCVLAGQWRATLAGLGHWAARTLSRGLAITDLSNINICILSIINQLKWTK